MLNRTISKRFAVAGIAVSALIGWTIGGYAAETKTIERTVTIYNLRDDAPDFYAKVKAVCADANLKLSEKARIACKAEEFPKLTKSLRFRNAGVGAELNTLAAQR